MKKTSFLKNFALVFLAVFAFRNAFCAETDFFWESPLELVKGECAFPCSSSNGDFGAVAWQEIERTGADSGKIWISAMVSDGKEQRLHSRIFGPVVFFKEVPSIVSIAVNSKNIIAIVCAESENSLAVLASSDFGKTFEKRSLSPKNIDPKGARIFANSRDEFALFVSQRNGTGFSIIQALSFDGLSWREFEPFAPCEGIENSFVPFLLAHDGADYVVFQGLYNYGTRFSYQIFSSVSYDGEITWTKRQLVSDCFLIGEGLWQSYKNQGAQLFWHHGRACMVWERTPPDSRVTKIYYTELDGEAQRSADTILISSAYGASAWPRLFDIDGRLRAVWFSSNAGKNSVHFATRDDDAFWHSRVVSPYAAGTSFAVPLVIAGEPQVYWLSEKKSNSPWLSLLSRDIFAPVPKFEPISFKAGKKSSAEKVSVRLKFPFDPAGIEGYSFCWSQNPDDEPPKEIQAFSKNDVLTLFADNDNSPWHLCVRVVDFAGNWSDAARISYIRDITPPPPPEIDLPKLDAEGFVFSNTCAMSWRSPKGSDAEGYSFAFQLISPPPNEDFGENPFGIPPTLPPSFFEDFASEKPPRTMMTKKTSTGLSNVDDGIYSFSVCAIDEAGNISPPAVIRLAFDKYVPSTIVSGIDCEMLRDGSAIASIKGRGFRSRGNVTDIHLSIDGKRYDYDFSLADGDFEIDGDRLISSLNFGSCETGEYFVFLNHASRGIYLAPAKILLRFRGNIKYGRFFERILPPNVKFLRLFGVQIPYVVLSLALLTVFVATAFSARLLRQISQGNRAINKEIRAVIQGENMEKRKKNEKLIRVKLKGVSLRWKIIALFSALTIGISVGISLPLMQSTTKIQRGVLVESLRSRVSVLLDSFSSGMRAYLPGQNILELGYLPEQSSALEEVASISLLGIPASSGDINIDHVWATNDPDIEEKIDTKNLVLGASRLVGEEIAEISRRCQEANSLAVEAVDEFATELERLTREGVAIALSDDEKSIKRRREISTITTKLSSQINDELIKISKSGSGSIPEFSQESISRENSKFTFFAPVLYRQGSERNYVRGIVIVKVEIAKLLDEIDAAGRKAFHLSVTITCAGILLGIIFAALFSNMVILPLSRLSRHMVLIRDTEDKEELKGQHILTHSKDEIEILCSAVNEMTDGLVTAAAASKDLSVGKEIQKMFLPLSTDGAGEKQSTGKYQSDFVDIFGYYEGARGVSGDYFDYKRLDQKHYAIIKCDVAGKGVPASLIMVEVATLFSEYFGNWRLDADGYNLAPFVSRVNDMLESRGFKGRFAAFTLCIFNSESGDLYFCNAGDSLLHFYNAKSGKKITDSIAETAAAGVFSSSLINSRGGFPMQKRRLGEGDVLFLYTDGIEEAKRLFRDKDFQPTVCGEKNLAEGELHGTHAVGADGEELSAARVGEIIEAVFAKRRYVLKKYHSPEPDEVLEFDFSFCEGTVQDAIMALVSVEKVFRMYKPPNADERDQVVVDRKIDSFLNRHFLQYGKYCLHRCDHSTMSEYMCYTHVREDEQYDDLTILGIQKKRRKS